MNNNQKVKLTNLIAIKVISTNCMKMNLVYLVSWQAFYIYGNSKETFLENFYFIHNKAPLDCLF